nr:arabinogalactan protein 23-like [Ipomoea batatas]
MKANEIGNPKAKKLCKEISGMGESLVAYRNQAPKPSWTRLRTANALLKLYTFFIIFSRTSRVSLASAETSRSTLGRYLKWVVDPVGRESGKLGFWFSEEGDLIEVELKNWRRKGQCKRYLGIQTNLDLWEVSSFGPIGQHRTPYMGLQPLCIHKLQSVTLWGLVVADQAFFNSHKLNQKNNIMEMKKIACAALVAAAASMSVAMATDAASTPAAASAPSPASDAVAALPAIGSLVGASLVSFFAIYMH